MAKTVMAYTCLLLFTMGGSFLCSVLGQMYDAVWFGVVLSGIWGVAVGYDVGKGIAGRRWRGNV